MRASKTTLTLIVWGLAIISGFFLLYTSQSVHDKRRALRYVNAQMDKQNQAIRVLQAEWAFLSSPSNVEKMLNKTHSGTAVSSPPQIFQTIQDADFMLGNPMRERVLDASLQE